MVFATLREDILVLLKKQLGNTFVLDASEAVALDQFFDETLSRCETCFSQNANKYYHLDGEVFFNPFHSVQYMTFLYFFANTICQNSPSQQYAQLCDKLYYLNKVMNGVDIYYAVQLPDYFAAEHPVGSVMGRAQYGDGFMFYQNCSVGGVHRPNNKIVYPVLGKDVKMFAGSMILGACKIGDRVNIAAGTLVKNQDVPSDVNVFGSSPNIIIKSRL